MTSIETGLSCLLLLALLLGAAAWQDIRHRRIPNPIVFSGAILGLALNTGTPPGLGFLSELPGGLGFTYAAAGLGLGLAVMLPFYLMRTMGAGDVKLIAMVGAFLGPVDVLGVILGTFIAGGVLALAFAAKTGRAPQLVRNVRLMCHMTVSRAYAGSQLKFDEAPQSVGHLPYAVAIALGTLGYLLWQASRLSLHIGLGLGS